MSSPPVFSRRIDVAQQETGDVLVPLLLIFMACSAPVMAVGVWLLDADATGWRAVLGVLGMLGLIVLLLVLLVVGMGAWMWFEGWRQRRRGQPPLFNGAAQVDIGERGLSVQGLGHADWIDVLAIEGVPDSDSYLIVHTRPFQKLMLSGRADELAEVIGYYLAQKTAATAITQGGILQVRAVVFNGARFLAWIMAGYALAAAMGVAMLMNLPDSFVKAVVGIGLLVPLVAWLVWAIPFAQLDNFAPQRVRAFEIDGARLRSTDDEWQIDLQRALVRHRHASGIGYAFDFISIRPGEGRRLDLLLAHDDRLALMRLLDERGLLNTAPR